MGFFDIPNGGGWFSQRSRAERAELKRHKERAKTYKKARKYVSEATERGRHIETAQREIDYLKDREREAKVRAELKRRKKAMKKPTSLDYLGEFIGGIKIKKKKQGRLLSRKRRIGIL